MRKISDETFYNYRFIITLIVIHIGTHVIHTEQII